MKLNVKEIIDSEFAYTQKHGYLLYEALINALDTISKGEAEETQIVEVSFLGVENIISHFFFASLGMVADKTPFFYENHIRCVDMQDNVSRLVERYLKFLKNN